MNVTVFNIFDLETEWQNAPDGFHAGLDFKSWLAQNVIQLRAALAAAVQAEREACAVTSETCNRDDWSHSFDTDWRDIIAAAIRARGVNMCKCGINEATEPHPCPYQSDVNNDKTYLCTCCSDCAYECTQDI